MINILMMDDKFTIQEVFESAVNIVRNLPKEGPIKPSDELKLKLYAYYKQATHGPNDTSKPRFYQIVEAYKWDAWRKLANMTKEDAMLNYIRELKLIMDTISGEEAHQNDNKHLEDVLGKKFYDYWFNHWRQRDNRKRLATVAPENEDCTYVQESNKYNDMHSNSSNDSSVSLLEDTQSAGDGYKTPTSHEFKETFSGEVSHQFVSAVLRLQHGLEETKRRLDMIEDQLRHSINSIRLLENQTHIKKSVGISPKSVSLVNFLKEIKRIHWFYLSYPFLVYFIIRALERKKTRTIR